MANRIKLTADLDALIPGEDFTIGDQVIVIKPLNIVQIKLITGRVNVLIKECSSLGVSLKNIHEPDKFALVSELIIEKFPEILEELSNIEASDLQRLPPEIVLSLLDKCISVNIKAKESLMGNWKSLAANLKSLNLSKKEEKPETQK